MTKRDRQAVDYAAEASRVETLPDGYGGDVICTRSDGGRVTVQWPEGARGCLVSRELFDQMVEQINAGRWIPVTERLPTYRDAVWGYDGKSVFLCEFHGRYGWQSYGASCDREGLNSETLYNITHWAEVAEPPPPETK